MQSELGGCDRAVVVLQDRFGVSQRFVCRLAGQNRNIQRLTVPVAVIDELLKLYAAPILLRMDNGLSSSSMHCSNGALRATTARPTSSQDCPRRIHSWSRVIAASGESSVGEAGRRPYIKLFNSVKEARLLAEHHRIDYNTNRPHSAL